MAGVKGRSGRKKGSKNAPRRSLLAFIQETFPNYDPLLSAAKRANNPNISEELRHKADETVLKYTYTPKRPGDDENENVEKYQVIVKQYVLPKDEN